MARLAVLLLLAAAPTLPWKRWDEVERVRLEARPIEPCRSVSGHEAEWSMAGSYVVVTRPGDQTRWVVASAYPGPYIVWEGHTLGDGRLAVDRSFPSSEDSVDPCTFLYEKET